MTQNRFDPPVGSPQSVAPGIKRILAPNPSPMTYRGTNSYIWGKHRIVVIDPGPNSERHLSALMAEINTRPVEAILVTHSHKDHSPLASRLSTLCGAPVYGFGNSTSGRSPIMSDIADMGIEGGEGVDPDFHPDKTIKDFDVLPFTEGEVTCVHTPGHFGNHMCFSDGETLFSGDHVMGWASSLISPPDGDLSDYMKSCRKLIGRPERIFLPGHGAPITDPQTRLDQLINHRRQRETQILRVLEVSEANPVEITKKLYADVPASLHPAAMRNVFAHLIDLHQRQVIAAKPSLSVDALYHLLPSH
ncbi:MAG: MBL fold metallo-hydrolase [Pseudoruegeria sp.]